MKNEMMIRTVAGYADNGVSNDSKYCNRSLLPSLF